MNTLKWSLFILLAVSIGIYPFLFLLVDMSQGLLATKPVELLTSKAWYTAFYLHIIPGGIALLSGWSQFGERFRSNNLAFHRTLGKVYLIAVAISGTAGLYIAQTATGWIASILGFSALALAWLYTSTQAYLKIRKRDIDSHQYWMIRSYALCWAAVMLRLYLPLFQFAFGMEFIAAYQIIAWLCWVPNLVVAEIIIHRLHRNRQEKETLRSQTIES